MSEKNYTVEFVEINTDSNGRAIFNRPGIGFLFPLEEGVSVRREIGTVYQTDTMYQLLVDNIGKTITLDEVMKIRNFPRLQQDFFIMFDGSVDPGTSTFFLYCKPV